MTCPLCEGVGEGFCENHNAAYNSIIEAFKKWQLALPISWPDYLKKIIENEYTGRWAREVAEYLLRHERKPPEVK
ncbi:MAG: hypothetical protein QXQ43_06325 [Nitrososphaerota archaeon]